MSKIIKAPSHLTTNQKRAFRRELNDLADSGVELAQSDAPLLAELVLLREEATELRATIAKEGRFTTASTGLLVDHPAVRQLKQIREQILRTSTALSATPKQRVQSKIRQEEDEPEDFR